MRFDLRDSESVVTGVWVSTHHMDVTDAAAVATLPARVVDEHGSVTVLVDNVGVALAGSFADAGLDDVRWVLDVNLHAVIAHTHAFLPVLRTQRAAHIVLLSSMFGLVAPAGQTAYATAKFGVRGFGERCATSWPAGTHTAVDSGRSNLKSRA